MPKHNYVDVAREVVRIITEYVQFGDDFEKQKIPAYDSERDFEANIDGFKDKAIKRDMMGDDLSVIEVVMGIEEEFEVDISDEWLGRHGDDPTIDDFVNVVLELLK